MTEEKTEEMRIVLPTAGERREVVSISETKRKAGERAFVLRSLAEMFGMMLLGFLFGGVSFPLGLYPLGCALVAAPSRYTTGALAGVLLRCLYLNAAGVDAVLPAVCVFALWVCRVAVNFLIYGKAMIFRARRLPDALSSRILLCAVFVLGVSLANAIYNGAGAFVLLRAVLMTVASTSFAFLFAFFFEEEYRSSPAFEAGLGAVVFCGVLALMPFFIEDFSVGLAAAFAVTLYVGFLGAPTRSALVGLLCGLASGGFHAPVMALAGLVAGIFSHSYAILGACGAILVTVCTTFYFGDMETVTALLPELFASSLLVTVMAMLRLLPGRMLSEIHTGERENAAALLLAKRCDMERERRMMGLSKAMESLSCMAQNLSEKFRRPRPEKLSEKCIVLWQKYCDACPNECSCRGLSELESEKVATKLASRLMSSGKIDRERLYEITRVRCPYLDAIAEELSACSAKMLEDAIREDKTKVFALDYETMSQMFADAAAEGDMRMPVDKVLSDRLRRAFYRAGLRAENVLVCGDRKKTVIATGGEIAKTEFRPSDIRAICEGVCTMRFGLPSFMLESGKSALMLESAPVFKVESIMKQFPKKGETVCGDSLSVSQSHDDYYYCFLCDGMGSGEEAALTSKLCRVFLEKMLVCGNKKSTTLEMLNNLLSSRGAETFATIDLCEIDLMLGVASFLKCGAVPSYVMRGGNLYKIASGTFPIGILPQVSAEVTDFELCEGDVILLCSDGIASDIEAGEDDNGARFLEMITNEWCDDLSMMADKILSFASDICVRNDDMSVALLRICRAE